MLKEVSYISKCIDQNERRRKANGIQLNNIERIYKHLLQRKYLFKLKFFNC